MLAWPVGRCLGLSDDVGGQPVIALGRRRRADGLNGDARHPRHDREAQKDVHPSSLSGASLERREEVPKKTLRFRRPP